MLSDAASKETRAWTIHAGWKAPKVPLNHLHGSCGDLCGELSVHLVLQLGCCEAAGVIHTDFEKGFIKAELTSTEILQDM